MSLRGPITCTAGLLFLIWIYFTIHQFWNTPQMDTESSILMHMQHINPPAQIQPDTHTSSSLSADELQLPTAAPSIISLSPTTFDAPTAQPSAIYIKDKYLSEQDEIELTFEFDNDNHLYLYDVPYFADDSIFIMSMVTNSSELALQTQLQTLDEISCIFKDTYFLIFESNSLDDTPQVLNKWSMNHNNATHHRSFCESYVYGFHRPHIHSYEQTGDYLHDLFTQNTSKAAHVLRVSQNRKTDVLVKNIVFGDAHVMDAMEQFKKEINTRFLSRIEKYSFYRNFLLHKMYGINKELNMKYNAFSFDYLMILDLDIFGFQQRLLLSELYYYHKHKRSNQNNGNVILCSHGTLAHGFYVDTFASVDIHHKWYYEYQRNTTYENVTDQYLKGFPRHRFEAMRSCFGGVIIYSNVSNIIESQCNYDPIWSEYDVAKSVPQSAVDLQYKQVTLFANKMRDWRPKKKSKVRRYKRRDNHICEHIAFHYCLYYKYNYSTAIAKYAYLFYEPVEMYKLDFNERLIEQTPAPTSETFRDRKRRERKARLKREREQRKANLEQDPQIAQLLKEIGGIQAIENINEDPFKKADVEYMDEATGAQFTEGRMWKMIFIIFIVLCGCVVGIFALIGLLERYC